MSILRLRENCTDGLVAGICIQYELIIWIRVAEHWSLNENMHEVEKDLVDFIGPNKWLGFHCTLMKRVGNVSESSDKAAII